MNDRAELENVLQQGRIRAEGVATATVDRVRKAMGFLTT